MNSESDIRMWFDQTVFAMIRANPYGWLTVKYQVTKTNSGDMVHTLVQFSPLTDWVVGKDRPDYSK